MKKKFLTAYITLAFLGIGITSFAQDNLPNFDTNVEDEIPAAPIDGFILTGLIIGAAYGIGKKK
ncbi:hypothetical protein ACFQ3R_10625 [Mesonia ostreae]|uniref:Uncharacterized protein n=1 Tax=Mesonia ostreae TaxID=861110 RepID=A0ABU2KGJ0_9FLAO|nr:hypothetical protein [Mesonia ostreae]MDT0293833.1 hypothetical protein [Mesonia ostreae]